MSRLICDYMEVGALQTNCYIVHNIDTKECIIVDPGDEAEKICRYLTRKELKLQAIFLTHGHFDHIGAVSELKDKYSVPVYAAAEEKDVLQTDSLNMSSLIDRKMSLSADYWVEDGQKISCLGQEVTCILTPGHTQGGMCYYFPQAGFLFSGDTLFQESTGRTDFPTGSMSRIIRSIREKLFVLPEAVQVYPGHGPKTSIENEKMFNPFAAE